MPNQDEKSANLNFWLAVCWIAGILLAVLVAVAFSAKDDKLAPVSSEVFKWIGQVLLPICLLVLSRVFGLTIVKQFGAFLNRKNVYWLTFALSLAFIVFAIGTIFAAAYACPGGLEKEVCQFHQLQTLSNSGTTILTVLIWPILSMLLDYLFPKGEQLSTAPDNPLSTPQ
jgi:hypothetical protein